MPDHLADKTPDTPGPVAAECRQPRQFTRAPRAEPRLLLGGLAGCGAAALGAAVWAVVTVLTQYQIGWMAVGVGWFVGSTVRCVGKSTLPRSGVVGAGLALFGCLAGNLLMIGMVATRQEGAGLTSLLVHLNGPLLLALLQTTLHPTDLLFYGLAVYTGYRFALPPGA